MPQIVLLAVALLVAWRPVETTAATAVVIALALLLLVPWGHRRTAGAAGLGRAVVLLVASATALSAAGGWDRATAAVELALAATVVAMVWIASREEAPERLVRLLALGVAALAIWALWQVTVGFERSAGELAALPEALQANAAERIESGRAFASLLLPGHLAVLLATALPILITGVRRSWRTVGWLAGSVVCGVGLVLTRSPIGIALAVLTLGVLAARRRRALLIGVPVMLAIALVLVVASRSDVTTLDPVRLRLDNWRTAVWAWRTSPLTGVGVGSYGQATRAVPFEVGNLPAHAHSLPLEWLAEGGIAGLAACGLAALWLGGLLRRLWPRRPELAVGLAVIPLHNLVDFSLYTSGVAVPWAVLLGWGVAAARADRPDEPPARHRGLLVAAAAVAVALSLLHATSVTVEDAARLSAVRDGEQLAGALTAQRLAPWRQTPPLLAAEAALAVPDRERLESAALAIERGRRWRPHSAALAAAAGELAMARGLVPTAAAELWTAHRVQPRSQPRRDGWSLLEERLEGLGDAARR